MVVIGCDHGGYLLQEEIIKHFKEKGIRYGSFGSVGEVVDYPDVAEMVCREITKKEAELGILICGTGIGMSMAANKIKGIRAAVCGDCYSARFTRLHNDANVLCLGARVIGTGLALQIVDEFLNTEFEGGRHSARVEKVMKLEEK